MNQSATIKSIRAREVLDSRGIPTIEADVLLSDGSLASAIVPSGASTGAFEAVELRDNDKTRYLGQGVLRAVSNVNDIIAPKLMGANPFEQNKIDEIMFALDQTPNLSKLGANAVLSVSLAAAKACAKSQNLDFYQYLGNGKGHVLPVPMMNIMNGGKHADSSLNIQEFMVVPISATSFSEGLRQSSEVFHTLKKLLRQAKHITAVGDEGGFAPKLGSDKEAIDWIIKAIEAAGFTPGVDFGLAIDGACTEMYEEAKKIGEEGKYLFWKNNQLLTQDQMLDFWSDLCKEYPILSIEDGMSEEDWSGWAKLTTRLGNKIQLVGDDLFVTNPQRIQKGMDLKVTNSVLIKFNQIGSLSKTLEAIQMTQNANWSAVISHRSGETEDVTIADIAVATNAGQIKTGAPSRTDRIAKYNQLLRIEEKLGSKGVYLGRKAFSPR